MAERPTAIREVSKEAWWAPDAPRGIVYFEDGGGWWMRCPQCGMRSGLGNHTVTREEDGTLTMSPSLLCPSNAIPADNKHHCSAHYFVNHNQLSGAW